MEVFVDDTLLLLPLHFNGRQTRWWIVLSFYYRASFDESGRTEADNTVQYTSRGGAAAARWAHNPKVAGSSPAPATRNNMKGPDQIGAFS